MNRFFRHFMHPVVALAAAVVLLYVLVFQVIGNSLPAESSYQGAELRFQNVVETRVSDFALKEWDHSFLFAPRAPASLRLGMEFSDSGKFVAQISSQYVPSLCTDEGLDQAVVTLSVPGGTVIERVPLKRGVVTRTKLNVSKGQRIAYSVQNRTDASCGRAVVRLYAPNPVELIGAMIMILWGAVAALCLLSGGSLWIATVGLLFNLLVIGADATLGSLSTTSVIVNGGLALGFTGLLFLFATIPLGSSWASRLLTGLVTVAVATLFCVPALFLAYAYVFDSAPSDEIVHAILQTYDSQAIEFWDQYIGIRRSLMFLGSIAILFLALRQISKQRTAFRLSMPFAMLLIAVAVMMTTGRTHSSAIVDLITRSILVYKMELAAFRSVADNRQSVSAAANRNSAFSNDLAVVVIGESVNRKFLSAYGYVRDTTPNLRARIADDEVVLFTSAYSNHTHSNPTMSMILTQASQYGGKAWIESPSVFNYARSAGLKTHWLTNHRLLGGWSNHITTIAREADRVDTINFKIGIGLPSSSLDEDLLPMLSKSIDQRGADQIAFVHLYNSHSQYCHRFPPEVATFDGTTDPKLYGALATNKKISGLDLGCYENTVVYTDKVLESMIKDLEKRGKPAVLLYIADHAEEVFADRTHNSGMFTFDMINIPLFVWANAAWRERHADLWANLQGNANAVFTNDFLLETALGIAGVQSESLDSRRDLSSERYTSPQRPLTLHGRVAVDSDRNWNYWQRRNSLLASTRGIDLIADDVMSVGEVSMALVHGIQRIRAYAHVGPEGQLLLGKDTQTSDDAVSLPAFLDALPASDLAEVVLTPDPSMTDSLDVLKDAADSLAGNFALLRVDDEYPDTQPLRLWSPEFADSVDVVSTEAISEPPSQPVLVRLRSRFSDPPPLP